MHFAIVKVSFSVSFFSVHLSVQYVYLHISLSMFCSWKELIPLIHFLAVKI